MIVSFLLTIAIIIAFGFFICKGKKDFKTKILIAILGTTICVAVLIFPLVEEEKIIIKIPNIIYYAIESIYMNQDTEILSKIDLSSAFGVGYYTFLNILFIAMPILTTGVIFAFLSDLFVKIKFNKIQEKNLYVFSELNEKSIAIAKNFVNQKNTAIVFTNTKDATTTIKSLILEEKITDVNFGNEDNAITFYLISQDEDENLNDSLELIEKYKNRKNTKIYVINNEAEAPLILDSTDKGEITVEIVNEKERAIFNLLNNEPLYKNAINNTISVLVVGCGEVGKEFLKDATWCSMMPGYKFKATVIDIIADKIKESIEIEAPEFLSNYDITFVNADIKSQKALSAIDTAQDINYILVAMENDTKNLDVAILLRRLFLKRYKRMPVISLWIKNEYKEEQVNLLVNERNMSCELTSFGSIKDLYYDNRIVNSEIEDLAKQIHLAYCPDDTKLKSYNKREYNKRSSRASALHIKYKLYSILKDNYSNNMEENLKLLREIHSKEIEDILAKNEHDRWNAYMRSIGYTLATTDQVKEYYLETGRHEHSLARLHPALVEQEELDIVSNELRVLNPNIDLKSSDYDIVSIIFEKL